jgi:UDP:flavonoid glycosyltransferase YjiC (YdhE family)
MATVEGYSEQEYVAERLARYKAGTRMYFSKTTPESLAAQILQHMKKRWTTEVFLLIALKEQRWSWISF